MTVGTLLRGDVRPDALRRGGLVVEKVYRGAEEVWTGYAPPPTPGTTYWYSFEGGPIGANVAPGDVGSGTPFDQVTFPYAKYATGGRNGALCGEIPAGPSITSQMQWHGVPDPLHALGFWIKVGQMPTGDTRLCDLRNTTSGGTVGGVLLVPSQQCFRLMVGSSGHSATDSPTMTVGLWYWITLAWNSATAKARIQIHRENGTMFHDTFDYSVSSTYATPAVARFGRITTAGELGTTQFDDVQFNVGSAELLPPWIEDLTP